MFTYNFNGSAKNMIRWKYWSFQVSCNCFDLLHETNLYFLSLAQIFEIGKKQVGLILWLEFLALKCSNLSKPFALDRDVLRNEEGGGDLGYGAGMHKAGLSYITQFYRLKWFNGIHTSAKLGTYSQRASKLFTFDFF